MIHSVCAASEFLVALNTVIRFWRTSTEPIQTQDPFWCTGHSISPLNSFIRARLLEARPRNGPIVYRQHVIDENSVLCKKKNNMKVGYQDVLARRNRAIVRIAPSNGSAVCI